MPPEDIDLAIRHMLEQSPVLQTEGEDYGDWAIHDDENFGLVRVREHDDLDILHDLALGIAEHGPAFSAWATLEDDRSRWPAFSEAYLGEFETVTAYGEHVTSEMGWREKIDAALPSAITQYVSIDAAGIAEDMRLAGDITVVDQPGGGLWIFRTDV